jgi:ABC-type dipeptide/oligopeptide/nickel transport system permease component
MLWIILGALILWRLLFPVSFSVTLAALLFFAIVGIPLAILAALVAQFAGVRVF